jgi:hypothetical protein
MTTTVNYSQTDMMAIAGLVADGHTDEPSTYEVEYKVGGHALYIEVAYEFDAHEERGGSFEGYDFERIGVVDSEYYDIIKYECLDRDGEPVACDFTPKRLLDILN